MEALPTPTHSVAASDESTYRRPAFSRQVRILLNKLSFDQCERIAFQLADLEIRTNEDMNIIAQSLAHSAIQNHVNGACYCMLLREFERSFATNHDVGEAARLMKVFCDSFRDEFQQLLHQQLALAWAPRECLTESDTRRRDVGKVKVLGSARFASLLFLHGLVSEEYLGSLIADLEKGPVIRDSSSTAPADTSAEEADLVIEVHLLSGGRCATRGAPGEAAASLAERLAGELGVVAERLKLVAADGEPLSPSSALAADRSPLQCVVLALNAPQLELLAECLCAVLEVLAARQRGAALVPQTAPRLAATVRAAPTTATALPALPGLGDGELGDATARRRLVELCAAQLSAALLVAAPSGRPALSTRLRFLAQDALEAATLQAERGERRAA